MIDQRIRERGSVNRRYINDHVGIVKRLFRWAVAEELVPVTVHQALEAVESIHKGRDPRVKESEKIRPARDQDVQAALKFVSPQVRTIIELLLLTGMRPDEATIMRPCDINQSGLVWSYVPESHKTKHLGIDKIVLLGPKAQKILESWLDRAPAAYLFDPREVVGATLARRHNGKPATKKAKPRRSRRPRPHYDDESLCQAVERACEKACVAKWTPGQLRHTAATKIRRKYGLEAARLILGHQSMATTEIYAEKDMVEAIGLLETVEPLTLERRIIAVEYLRDDAVPSRTLDELRAHLHEFLAFVEEIEAFLVHTGLPPRTFTSSPWLFLHLGRLYDTRRTSSQDFAASLGIKKALLTVPVRKPAKEWFIQTYPDASYYLETAVLELKEDRETYLVDRDLWEPLATESTFSPRALFTTMNRQGVLFLWPIRLPGPDGRSDDWSRSALEAAQMAKGRWVRVAANMSLGAYDVFEAAGDLAAPEWPDTSFKDLLRVAFKDRLIETLDHPVLRKLRGEQ